MKNLTERSIMLTHFEANLNKLRSANNEIVKERIRFKLVGIISLAEVLDIINHAEVEKLSKLVTEASA